MSAMYLLRLFNPYYTPFAPPRYPIDVLFILPGYETRHGMSQIRAGLTTHRAMSFTRSDWVACIKYALKGVSNR